MAKKADTKAAPAAEKPVKEAKATPVKGVKKQKEVILEVGKHYQFTKLEQPATERSDLVPASTFFGKVVGISDERAEIRTLRQGDYSNVQSFERSGLAAKEVSREYAYNVSIDSKHYA